VSELRERNTHYAVPHLVRFQYYGEELKCFDRFSNSDLQLMSVYNAGE